MFEELFLEKIRLYRMRNGYTQEEMAQFIGNKEYRKLIKGSEFHLPKSILFAAGDDKAKALTYAHKLIKELLTPAETEVLKETEKNILA